MNSEELLKNVQKVLQDEGASKNSKNRSHLEILEELILPAFENSKDTLSSLYIYEPPRKFGIVGKIKSFILIRFRNIIFNVVEKQSMKQQKVNEIMFKAVNELVAENKELRERLGE